MRLRELVNCDPAASCLMFFKICRSSTADEDAHRPAGAMPSTRGSGRSGARKEFLKATAQGLGAEDFYSNPESLPSLEASFHLFMRVYPRFRETRAVDALREREYAHLREDVCLDYSGFGLFSQRESAFFNLAYISANLPTHALYGAAEHGTVEAYIRSRIMRYMNLSDADYSMVFTASRGTAYKLLAESYPFASNNRLLTVYDYESDAVSWMAGTAKEKGAKIMNASFKWPNLKIAAPDLHYKLQEKKKKKEQSAKGLFVFPVQSRVTGAKYSYQWMSQAQANKWHVLLDASALAPKDMDSLALSLFRPEFIVTSFYKVFGADPTGFGCLFIKNSIIQGLQNSDRARGVGMVRIIPASSLPRELDERLPDIHEDEYVDAAEYVDPVSAFSGPITQFYSENVREKAVLERITASGRDMNIAGFDDSSGRMSEEDWDDGFSHSHGDGEFSGRESGSGEIEEEVSEAVFPLTRRGGGAAESEDHEEEGISFKVVKDPDMEDDDDRFLDEARGDNNRFLSRIQEEETDECDDVSPPHEEDSPEGGNGSVALGSPLFHSPSESPDSFENRLGPKQVEESKGKVTNEVRSEADKLENSIMFRDNRDFALREGRDVDSFFEEDQILPAEPEGSNGGHYLGSSGANGRRLQSWSPGEGSSQWEAQYAMSEEGSPMYLDEDNGNVGQSADDVLDEEGPVVCNGLDHADSQGLNKTNLRLRFLINWLINSLLKLRHPAQIDTPGTNLVHIYGPEVHFDRGHAMAFNLFDWNGVPVRAELVQRLADRNNISLGLGTLCNIVYPEGATDLAGLWFSKGAEGGSTEGKAEPPRASNASKHERPSEIPVVTAALGFVSTFEDVYRLWAFVAKFLDADFVKREEWLYHSLNQEIHVL